MIEFCGSPLWDSNKTWHTDDPHFVPCFELTILIWVPCVLLFIFAPLDIYYIKTSKYANIPWGFINITRLVIPTLLICLCIVDISIATTSRDEFSFHNVHVVSPVIKIITFLTAIILAHCQRKSGIVSSGLLFLFWFILWLFAIPQFRSEITRFQLRQKSFGSGKISWDDFQFLSYLLYFSMVTLQLLVNCFSDKKPLISIYKEQKKPCPEIRASFLRKLFFLWFDSFAWMGYRKPLTTDDMWNVKPEDITSELIPEFDRHWQESVEKGRQKARNVSKTNKEEAQKSTNGSILPAMFKTFGGPFYVAGMLKLALDLLAFASPQLLNFLINFTRDSEAPLWHGILFAVGLFLVSVTSSLINGQFLYKSFLVGFRIRSALISAIYRKALTISNSSKKDTTVGEIVNLMIIDAQRFFELIQYLHIIWAGPLTIALSIYFLYEILGVAVFSGLALMILMLPLNAYMATKLKNYQIIQMKRKDERVKMMNETLSGIKVLKLYAWELSFQENIQNIRNKELDVVLKAAYMNGFLFFVWTTAPFFVTFVSFCTYVLIDEKNVFDANTAFVALSLFNILRQPLTMFPLLISFVMQAKVSIDRINKFLNSEDLDTKSITHEPDDSAIKLSDGSFSWGETLVLRNINLTVNRGSSVAVVGPVGSGKSSLISSILGETKKITGTLNVDGSLAFVAQQAWIQNATLKDNILFGRPFDKIFYYQVLEACALKQDIAMLPGGDETEIGEKGINLSGGQKQRVALARAVYSQADIYLLDDPLSAVDSHVGKHIFEKVIGPNGILANKTRLLVTHGISYLPSVENICVMDMGEISESGHYEKLIAQKGAFSIFIMEHLQQYDDDDEEFAEIKQILTPSAEGSVILETAISRRQSSPDTSVSNLSKISLRQSMSKGQTRDPARTVLIEKEESSTGSVGMGVYIRYFKSIGPLFCTVVIFGGIANQAFSVYSSMWLSEWSADPNNTVTHLRNYYLGVYGGLGFAQGIPFLAMSIAIGVGCVHAAKDLHDNLLGRTMRLPMSFFDCTPLGRIINRFSKDLDVVDSIIPQILRLWFLMIFNTVAIFVVISISTPIFMAVIVPIFILYYFIQSFYVRTSRQLKRIESVTRSPIYSHFTETLTGQSTIRAYSAQSRFITDSEQRVDFNQMCTYPSIVAIRWLGVRLEIVSGLVIFFSALFAVLGRGSISNAAIVGLSVSYALQITSVLNYLVRMTSDFETNIVANERLEEYSNIKTEAEWITKPVDVTWPSEGRIVFDNYKVRYRENLDLVLNGCSFEINAGEKVGIVGRTGAGKSSLTLGLFRIIEAAGGKITIDGLDISEMGLQSLRSRLTIIPQDPVLFSGTLRMNIDPFSVYTDDDVWLALELAHLKVFAKNLDQGLSFEVSEGGENLSVGQRQLVCLARALLRKTKILILDEATAAVDLETDDLIQKTIRSQFKECTVLTIAHRLNTIMDSDRVLVLDKGEVVEFESPKSLLDNRNSIFYGMCKDAGLVTK